MTTSDYVPIGNIVDHTLAHKDDVSSLAQVAYQVCQSTSTRRPWKRLLWPIHSTPTIFSA